MKITWNSECNAPCIGEITSDDGRSVLIQTDWDYPGAAGSFGWSPYLVRNCPECGIATVDHDHIYTTGYPVEYTCPKCHQNRTDGCPHQETDGTVDCRCGVTAGDFIASAGDYLDDHDGATADDPGYFQ